MEEPARLTLALEPLDDFLVVEPVDEDVETRTGLIIPQSAEAGCRSGVVTAVGAEAGGVDPGDKVLFPKDAGFDVRHLKKPLVIVLGSVNDGEDAAATRQEQAFSRPLPRDDRWGQTAPFNKLERDLGGVSVKLLRRGQLIARVHD